jgi:hypothetical protein
MNISTNRVPPRAGIEDALLSLSRDLPDVELTTLRGILSNVAQSLCPDGRFPEDARARQRFRSALKVLGSVQRHPRMTPNGIVYRGRPDFMTDELLARIQHEARAEVRPRAIWQRGHMLGVGGPLADTIANGPELRALVERTAGPVEATGVASYLFYEEEGAGLQAHVDTCVFSINVNIVLRHESAGRLASHLFVFSVDGKTREEILLEPGETIITFGDSIVHGRAPLAASEVVNNLTIGFQPAFWGEG